MKRYRVLASDFDYRCNFMKIDAQCIEDPITKEQIVFAQTKVKEEFKQQFGSHNLQKKLDRFYSLGEKPHSIYAFHNSLIDEIRVAYIVGSYYPALVSTCTFAEKILNHLIIGFKDDFRNGKFNSNKSKKIIYEKEKIQNWSILTDSLYNWNIIDKEQKKLFEDLKKIRDDNVHFNGNLYFQELSLKAILILQKIIFSIFRVPEQSNSLFFVINSEVYIRNIAEVEPHIKKLYIPNSVSVSPFHKVTSAFPWEIKDQKEIPHAIITDEEFIELRSKFLNKDVRTV